WRLEDGTILVQTVDFFTPVVDSPRLFGAIAAANAVSDIYAMGAEPLFALNVVGFPIASLPASVLREIMDGAQEVAEEIGIPVLGGHTVEDTEPKFGWVVTGKASEDRLWRNRGARPGDVLVLTKPLGTGIWATAAKHGLADEAGWLIAQKVMRHLNKDAARALATVEPHAVCDVTGFGLLGHLREMASASGVDIEVWCDSVPVLAGTNELVAVGELPGGSRSNLAWSDRWVDWDPSVSDRTRMILADAQTNGGLVAAVPREQVSELLVRLEEGSNAAAAVGVIAGWGKGLISCVSSTGH
ncbi:MAG: selenide, water dikinase SelD, partial [bacterium]|nr:selenide, water dikinase SelD [bacterium]